VTLTLKKDGKVIAVVAMLFQASVRVAPAAPTLLLTVESMTGVT